MTTYTLEEWGTAIASLGRLVDIRNFPDVAAEALLGERPVFLGRGYRGQTKALNPAIIGGLVIWTKGPVEILVEHDALRRALQLYQKHQAVIGLELTVTGFGGTFLEPGIPDPTRTAEGLKKVIDSGLVHPEAIVLRYDPLLRFSAPDDRILSNEKLEVFEHVISLFAPLGVKYIETKTLLLGEDLNEKYHHVWKRLSEFGVGVLTPSDFLVLYANLRDVAASYGMELFSCCMKHLISDWESDSGCLSADRLTKVGRILYGSDWSRLSGDSRASREACKCSRYWDLSNMKGHKKCGSQAEVCLYCTACSANFSNSLKQIIQQEIQLFLNGKCEEKYKLLME